jgi:twitching motility two-component system response regulator PilG
MNVVYKRPIIWVIDDSPTIRKIVAMTLRRESGEVIEYAEPLQVFKDVRRGRHPLPDVVLVDLLLPHIHGYRLIQFLRSRKPTNQMAIIVITRLDGAFPKLMARLAGANAYLPKPFTTQQLIALVMEYSPH